MNRFKKSAAVAALSFENNCPINAQSNKLIQVVVDNFDADSPSQNGKRSTHSLAMIISQSGQVDGDEGQCREVLRLSRMNRRMYIDDGSDIVHIQMKEKNPQMPQRNAGSQEVILLLTFQRMLKTLMLNS